MYNSYVIIYVFVLCRYNIFVIHVCVLSQWLEETFLPYLDTWEQSVEAREGFSKEEKTRMLLSRETRLGLCMNSKYAKYIYMMMCDCDVYFSRKIKKIVTLNHCF